MNKKQIYYMLLSLGFFVIFGLGFFGVKNLSQNVIVNYKALAEKSELLEEQNENEKNLNENTIKLKNIEEDNEKLMTKITEYNKAQDSISKINKIMEQSDVLSKELKLINIEKIEMTNLEGRNEVYAYNISLLGEGSYSNILDFIGKVGGDSTYYKIENLSIFPTNIINHVNISANISLFVVKSFYELEKDLILPTYEESKDPFYYGG